MEAQTAIICPSCNSSRLFKDGLRVLSNGKQKQRFVCRECGYRFSEKTNKELENIDGSNQISAKAKNLVTAQKIKICVDNKKPLTPENKGLIVKFQAYLDRNGYYKKSSYVGLLLILASRKLQPSLSRER